MKRHKQGFIQARLEKEGNGKVRSGISEGRIEN
jgi:hypothetical protein